MKRRSRTEIVSRLTEACLIAIIRTSKAEQVMPICEALLAGGIRALEITLTTPNALELIRQASKLLGGRALLGAGSVLHAAQASAVIEAGAEFIVSPISKRELAQTAHASERPVMLGAYTPTEAQAAYEMGADFIKLFPADKLGPSYVKALRAPMPHLRIVPTGGVDLNTAAEFLKAGCPALGVGSALLVPDILRSADWDALSALARQFVTLIESTRKGV